VLIDAAKVNDISNNTLTENRDYKKYWNLMISLLFGFHKKN